MATAAMPAHAWAADPTTWGSSSGILALRTILSLAFVLALLLLTLRMLRKLQGTRGATTREHPIASRGRLDLGARREIRVVDVHGRLLVVGITDQKMELLAELDPRALDAPEVAKENAAPAAALASSTTPPGIGRFLQRLITSF